MEIEVMDKYTAGIELSNKCREFYHKRMETAETMKQRLSPLPQKERRKSSLDNAMEKLSSEMTSLMDQDLSLMKQLLTLNEAIEDLKWQSRNNSRSFSTSSCDLCGSDLSVSDTEMVFHSDDEDKNTDKSIDVNTNDKSTLMDKNCELRKCKIVDNFKKLNNNINDSAFLEKVSEKLLDFKGSCDSGINDD